MKDTRTSLLSQLLRKSLTDSEGSGSIPIPELIGASVGGVIVGIPVGLIICIIRKSLTEEMSCSAMQRGSHSLSMR